ncbi:hypothetical protein C9374_001619 [Naegleria lovaniensis]|uniref:Uncharacterized protein n=1 Tax=Naegleria lovaniensis TaxID=51637 RepID=A0AA88GUJ7_NAELO|nr:uncharacterized protein C9374_001619 [Naegleria lovaniensis]KAG2387287.1 hypothetical protein C9374_001619 [Naegleria lovaniensis]
MTTVENLNFKIKTLLHNDPQARNHPVARLVIDNDYILKAGEIRYDVLMYLLNRYFLPAGYFSDDINHMLRLPLDSNDHKEQAILQACSWLGIVEGCDLNLVRGSECCTRERNIKFINDLLELVETVKEYRPEETKQQFANDFNFINHVCHNMNAVLVNDVKLFSNDMTSKFKKKKLPDIQSFQKDVEKANTHITRYQEIIEDLQSRINEQNKGIHVDMNQNPWDGNYFCMSNLSQEHLEKIKQVGEAVQQFSTLVDDFIRVFKEEFAQWVINNKPQEELSPLENVTLKITDSLTHLENFIENVHHIRESYQQLVNNGTTIQTALNSYNSFIQPKLDLLEQSSWISGGAMTQNFSFSLFGNRKQSNVKKLTSIQIKENAFRNELLTKDEAYKHCLSHEVLTRQLLEYFEIIHQINMNQSNINTNCDKSSGLSNTDFLLLKKRTLLPNVNGDGVFLKGHVKKGQVVCLYPGMVYDSNDPIFFQSIGNHFINQRSPCCRVDGNDRFISKLFFQSYSTRDDIILTNGQVIKQCDDSWLNFRYVHDHAYEDMVGNAYSDDTAYWKIRKQYSIKNHLNIGHYINSPVINEETSNHNDHQNLHFESNVMYYEYNFKLHEWPLHLRQYIPNLSYKPLSEDDSQLLTKSILLIALCDLNSPKGETELFANYLHYDDNN